ncbi:hypothetical protein ACPZ19_08350 [Amycolatopsis lurida]
MADRKEKLSTQDLLPDDSADDSSKAGKSDMDRADQTDTGTTAAATTGADDTTAATDTARTAGTTGKAGTTDTAATTAPTGPTGTADTTGAAGTTGWVGTGSTTGKADTADTTGKAETTGTADTSAPVPETTASEATAPESTPGSTTPETTAPEGTAAKTAPRTTSDAERSQPLFDADEVARYRDDWQTIQIAFVDDPQRAVREADELVARVIQSLAATFAAHKSELESQWSRGGEVATEDLRQALRQYRSFFHQLLSA